MSQSTAVRVARGAPRTAPAQRAPAPRLRVVDLPAHTRSRAGLVIGCVGLLALGLVALLVLNVSLERGAYELRSQRARSAQLTEQRQALQEALSVVQAPGALAVRAAGLGMVPAPNTVFLRRSDGTVLGVPSQAVGSRAPTVAKSDAPSAAASPSGTPKPSQTANSTANSTADSTAKQTANPTTKQTPGATPSPGGTSAASHQATAAPKVPTRTATKNPAATGKPVSSPRPTAH